MVSPVDCKVLQGSHLVWLGILERCGYPERWVRVTATGSKLAVPCAQPDMAVGRCLLVQGSCPERWVRVMAAGSELAMPCQHPDAAVGGAVCGSGDVRNIRVGILTLPTGSGAPAADIIQTDLPLVCRHTDLLLELLLLLLLLGLSGLC